MVAIKLFYFSNKQRSLDLYLLGLSFITGIVFTFAQDVIYLKDGTYVNCSITEISDFILYADIDNDPYPATFFADDVSYLDINPKNSHILKQLKKGITDAMKYLNPLEENSLYGFYFGIPYDSISNEKSYKTLYQKDSLGNPILVPYNPLEKSLSERLKSIGKSIGGRSLAWLIGEL